MCQSVSNLKNRHEYRVKNVDSLTAELRPLVGLWYAAFFFTAD